MRKLIFGLITIMAILVILSSNAAAAKVTLQASPKSITAGENVTVNVIVTPNTPITGMQFDLEFDDSVFQVVDVTEGKLFSQNGQSTLFSPGQAGDGMLRNVYGCILGSSSVLIPETFATITLTSSPDVQGTSQVCSQVCLKNVTISDSASKPLEARLVNESITVSELKKPKGLMEKLFESIRVKF